jgi:hypothetical protein
LEKGLEKAVSRQCSKALQKGKVLFGFYQGGWQLNFTG